MRSFLNLKSYLLPGEAGDKRTRFASHFHFTLEKGFVGRHWIFCLYSQNLCRSQWPRGLRRRSAAACLWDRGFESHRGMDLCLLWVLCVLSGRGLCNELITRSEESYWLWCVVVCRLDKPRAWGGHDPCWVATPQKKFLELVQEWLKVLDVHVTVHRDKFLTIKPTRCTNSSNLFLGWNSTCFGQFLCPSSGVLRCTYSNGICHVGLRTGGNCSSILILLASCPQTCMTYTIALCTVKNS